MSKKLAVFDMDFVVFSAASLAEERSINVIHNESGREMKFDNRTSFYGHWSKKNGGWLAEKNKGRDTPFLVEDFTIVDVQTPSSFGHCANIIKTQIESIQSRLGLGMKDYYGFVGKGDSWRVEASTILKYKQNREGTLRPLFLDEAKEYVVKKCNCEFQEHLEADDRVVMESHRNPNRIIVGVDKDYMGTACLVFNPDRMDVPQDCHGVGKLFLDDKNKVRGWGRKFFAYQVLYADLSDNYAANSACPEIKWGEKSTYNALVGCKTDKEIWEALVSSYKMLYPEPKKIVGWRGNEIEVDWKYVLQENLTMAHMLRKQDDKLVLTDILDRLSIDY